MGYGGTVPGTNILGPNELLLFRDSPAINTTVVNLTANINSYSAVYNLVIYADNASVTAPTVLLAQSGPQTIYAPGWVTKAVFPSVPVSAGTSYWLGVVLDSGTVQATGYLPNGYPNALQLGVTSNNPPTSFSGGVFYPPSDGWFFNIYANGCPFPTPTPTPTNTYTPTPTNTPTGTWLTSTPSPTSTKTYTVTPTPT